MASPSQSGCAALAPALSGERWTPRTAMRQYRRNPFNIAGIAIAGSPRGNMMRKTAPVLLPFVAMAFAAALAAVAGIAAAETFPSRPIRVVVPFAAGSATDIVPRTVFEQVSVQVGQTIIIDNRPGGGTTIGTAAVA